ncbi:hypothetical protein NW762_005372 [Fusarium torreyae]|uniref:DUF4419 domain-containing protein n=1 Tax=Fusarium torreyae TaxID=1237075 RepID=A0A9W8S3J6_9HYPO|nr:hypothetical protein NW762_005372 [Fusarium torreyae]
MPVTFNVVDHPANVWKSPRVDTPENLLQETSARDFQHCQRIIQTSLNSRVLKEQHVSPSENGFVWSAYHAYSQHHHLTIRPEDVWFAILTQLSFFINANAEDLRAFFVDHQGQKELEVIQAGTVNTVNFGALAERMAGLVSKNVKDPELGAWVMPNFSTTTDTDRVVASVLFMGAMQKYFSYTMSLTCGIPSVTLLGDVLDWQDIRGRLDRLEQLGDEPKQFAEMLRPILKHMILSFEQPNDPKVIRFWNTIATLNPMDSGSDYITGWITAFCFWNDKGKAKKRHVAKVLDRISYPSVDVDQVPVGFASVPVTVNDNGNSFKSIMLAGSFGIQGLPFDHNWSHGQDLARSEFSHETPTPELVRIQPLSGWLMYEDEAGEEAKARDAKKSALQDELKEIERMIESGDDKVWSEKMNRMFQLERQIQELEAY